MKNDSDAIKFQFPENYQSIIDNSSIVRDFDTFIKMAADKKLELSKKDILTNSSVKLINDSIIRKIPMGMKRPSIKSYPNVLALFILYSICGLKRKEIKGGKRYLTVNKEMLDQWDKFTNIDKYFYLFSLTFTNFSFEPIQGGEPDFEFSIILGRLNQLNGESGLDKHDMEKLFGRYQSRTILMTLNMLGLIDIEDAPEKENQGWNFISVQPKSFMNNIWKNIVELKIESMYVFSEEDKKAGDKSEFSIEDITVIGATHRFADKITETIPEFTQRLSVNMEERPGNYYFKVSLGKVWRKFKVNYRSTLDDLCHAILDAFDFDDDHLYDVTFLSSFGYRLTFHGAPILSYAEYPTTEDISIGNLPIKTNDEMTFTFDYGDNWQFSIMLEMVESVNKEINKIPDIELTESKGDAPEQYPVWE
jgi:hypothetical protein